MNWKNEIKDIFNLATLHSWCTQVNLMIEAFNKNYSDSKIIISYLLKKFQEKNLPSEHYIISLVLLYYQKYPVENIIELSINSLYSKLNKNDILFFKEHLFFGEFPLSADLSEDITNRSFFSPKAAIKKAMQINSVISKNDPIKTVLFMNFILSRMDMNEENKAMVAFLLLRVDIELPESLEKKVFKYLLVYKDVIEELLKEESGETVSLNDFYEFKKKINKIEIIEDSSLIDKNIALNNNESKYNDNKNDDISIFKKEPELKEENNNFNNLYNQEIESRSKNSVKTKFKRKSHKNNIGEKNSALSENVKNIETVKIDKMNRFKDIFIEKKNNIINEDKLNTMDLPSEPINTSLNPRLEAKTDTVNENGTKELEPVVVTTDNSNETDNNSAESMEIKNKIKNWEINLKQNKLILERILAGVKKIPNNIFLNSNKKKYRFNKENKESRSLMISGKRKISLGIVILVLALLPLFYILGFRKLDNTTINSGTIIMQDSELSENYINTGESGSKIKSSINGTSNDVESPVTPVRENDTTVFTKIPDNFPFKITIIDKNMEWKVKNGESITGFFFALQEFKGKLENTELEKISKLEWEDFFDIFKMNNPVRSSYHIIFPNEVFIIPLD